MNKWIGISLGTIFGISHIGMIGLLATRKGSEIPIMTPPVGDYTSYVISANKEGYKTVSYTHLTLPTKA